MKLPPFLRCFLLFLLCTLISSNAFAFGWFNVNATVQITPVGAQVGIMNTFPGLVQCRGLVYGMNNFGQEGRFDFFIAAIGMGAFGYAYINTYNSILIRAYAQAECRIIQPLPPIFYPY